MRNLLSAFACLAALALATPASAAPPAEPPSAAELLKLRDPGTRLDPVPERTVFADRDVWALRVTYDEPVGSDTWYVYLDPETAALVGYRFYHDEAVGDGEWIVVDGEAEDEGLRLPRVRRWYTNADDTYLATDTLEELEVLTDEEAAAAAEGAVPAEPEPLWATEISLSYVATTGNTETTSFGSSFDAERRPVPWGVHFFASYDRAEDRDVLQGERAYGGVRGTRALGERWELFGEVTGEQDEFSGFELRTVIASGATVHALLGPRHLLDFDLGATWTDVDRVPPAGDESFVGALAGMTYEWKLSDRSAFKERLVVYPNFETSSDWRLESFTSLESALNSWLALRFAYEVRFQNEPVGDLDDTDTTTRAALVLSF